MRFNRIAAYFLFLGTVFVGILFYFSSNKKRFITHKLYKDGDMDILVHPEKYRYYDTEKPLKNELNGKNVFVDNTDTWTELFPGLYVHSAFAEVKPGNSSEVLIRIIAVGRNDNIYDSEIECEFQKDNAVWNESLFDFRVLRMKTFRYFTLICISKNSKYPSLVGLKNKFNNNTNSWLNIHYRIQRNSQELHVRVCVPPVFYEFDDVQLVAEFLSYYDTVGASSFILYDYNITQNIKSFINLASLSGINITLVPWTVSREIGFSMRRVLQLASVQHCIFRSRGQATYVLPLNFEEFLVPRQHFSLKELMEELTTISKRRIGSYIFRKSYFCHSKDNLRKKDDIRLISSTDIFRENKMWPPKKRSRYIARPDAVIECGLHFVQKHATGWISANVPWQLAFIHHYTSCLGNKNSSKLVEDRTAESFRYEILLSKSMIAFRDYKKSNKMKLGG